MRCTNNQRGYFGIGIEHVKSSHNIGTLWRTAHIFGAAFIFTIGRRYQKQPSDTMCSSRHVPLYHYTTLDDMYEHRPYNCQLIGIELDSRAVPLETFNHPQRVIYLLGAEDNGLTEVARHRCHAIVQLPSDYCLNVAVAGSIVMYHRLM